MKKNIHFIATIEKLSHDGRGIARRQGKTVFAFAALPGETVSCRLLRSHQQFEEAMSEQLLSNPHHERRQPPCRHFAHCGGCSLQHLSPKAQIVHKEQTLAEQLAHIAGIKNTAKLNAITGPTQGYRQSARLSVRYLKAEKRCIIGFHRLEGDGIAELHRCEVLNSQVGHHLTELTALLNRLEKRRTIVQLDVAIAENTAQLIFHHKTALTAADEEKLRQFGKDHQFSIALQSGASHSRRCIDPQQKNLLSYSLASYGLNYFYRAGDFVQINPQVNAAMVAQAIDLLALQASDKVCDFFCGLGNFSLAIAQLADHVIGYEGNAAMVEQAKHNAQYNQLNNVDFVSADLSCEKTLAKLIAQLKKKGINKLLLDPPRSGAKQLIQALKPLKVSHIVYVSCNPATLARDAKWLAANYQLTASGIIDMFPHTKHIEAMAVFTRKNA